MRTSICPECNANVDNAGDCQDCGEPLAQPGYIETVVELTLCMSREYHRELHDLLAVRYPGESARDTMRELLCEVARELERQCNWEEDDWFIMCDRACGQLQRAIAQGGAGFDALGRRAGIALLVQAARAE